MKPLLVAINAKYIHTNNAVRLLKANSALEIDYIEFTIKDSIEFILKTILDQNPSIIGFSTYLWNVEIVKSLIIKIKSETSLPIILGGPEVSYDAQHFLKETQADLIVKGEGEAIIDDVIEYFLNHKSLKGFANVSTREYHGSIKEIANLDTLKLPYYSPEDIKDIPHRIQYIESSRGCPFRCSYCLSSLEKTMRFFSIETVLRNLEFLIKHNAKTIKFLDRTFNINKHTLTIIDYIIQHHNPNQTYQFEITADCLDEKIIDYIHAHAPKHLFRFEIGIQSTNPKTNELVDRYQDNETVFKLIKKIIQHDIINLHLDLIAGLPEENLTRFKQTFNEVYRLGAKELQLGFLKLLRGTKIRNEAAKYNYLFDPLPPYELLENHVLSKEDLNVIHHVEETLNLFHNKNHFGALIQNLTKEDPFAFFDNCYHYLKDHQFNFHRYQLDELYQIFENFLLHYNYSSNTIDDIRFNYLLRAKIKPKIYFPILEDKSIKRDLFLHIKNLSINDLFKHSIVLKLYNKPHVFYYKDQHVTWYKIDTPTNQ